MTDRADLADDILRGAAAIAQEIYGESDRAAQRRLYHEAPKLPVFKLDDSGVFYALRSRLREHLEIKSREKEAQIAAAATSNKLTEKSIKRRRRRASITRAA